MEPPAEHVHWLFATGFLLLGLCLLARAIVGEEIWSRRPWRAYLWPALLFGLGVLMWPVMVFYTNSTIHMVAHGAWAQTMMLAGAAFLHHALGWTALVGAIFPLVGAFRRRSPVWSSGFALTLVVISVLLYADRDVAPVFGHLSPLAGESHR